MPINFDVHGRAIKEEELLDWLLAHPNFAQLQEAPIKKEVKLPKPAIFWGGFDLDPSFYGKPRSAKCGISNLYQDQKILKDMQDCIDNGIPVIGICRSAQALNVLNGGILVQHIDNHTHKHTVSLFDLKGNKLFYENAPIVSSTHHQMMVAHKDGIILAKDLRGTTGVHWDNVNQPYEYKYVTEVVYYPKTKSLCIQPHPEWMSQDSAFVKWINKFIKEQWGQGPIDFAKEELLKFGD